MANLRIGRAVLVAAAIGTLPLAAFADEIVHFTNGAEMTVRSHVVEKDKQMVRLDLGANSFISFPMAMVDKIVNAGRDVYLNPVFHPANQAIAGGAAGVVPDNSIRGVAGPSSEARRSAGMNRGEASDAVAIPASGGPIVGQSVANSQRAFNPSVPLTPGERPQVIMPPGKRLTAAPALTVLPTQPPDAPPPTVNPEPQENPPPADPDSENPPDAP